MPQTLQKPQSNGTSNPELYRMFRRALNYLQQQGYSTERILNLAHTYGYEGFVNLAPDPKPQPEGQREEQPPPGRAKGESTPGEAEAQDPVSEEKKKSATAPGATTVATDVIKSYKNAEGLSFRLIKAIGDAVQYVEIERPTLGQVKERIRSALTKSLANTKHFLAVIGAIDHGGNNWTPKANSRRYELKDEIETIIKQVAKGSGAGGTQDYAADVDSAINKISEKAKRWSGTDFGKWLSKNVSVQPTQAGMGSLTDWIEVGDSAEGWF